MKARTTALLQSVAAVFAGGVLGSLIRISLSALQAKDASWPWMTMLINLTGAFILGCLLEFLGVTGEDVGARRLWRLGLGTGVIGGYTTYSTFILESDTRLTGHAVALALAYLVLSVAAGLICAGLGIGAGATIGARRNARVAPTVPSPEAVAQAGTLSSPVLDAVPKIAQTGAAAAASIALTSESNEAVPKNAATKGDSAKGIASIDAEANDTGTTYHDAPNGKAEVSGPGSDPETMNKEARS